MGLHCCSTSRRAWHLTLTWMAFLAASQRFPGALLKRRAVRAATSRLVGAELPATPKCLRLAEAGGGGRCLSRASFAESRGGDTRSYIHVAQVSRVTDGGRGRGEGAWARALRGCPVAATDPRRPSEARGPAGQPRRRDRSLACVAAPRAEGVLGFPCEPPPAPVTHPGALLAAPGRKARVCFHHLDYGRPSAASGRGFLATRGPQRAGFPCADFIFCGFSGPYNSSAPRVHGRRG